MYLAVNALLTHTPCDKLGELRTEIKYKDKFVLQEYLLG